MTLVGDIHCGVGERWIHTTCGSLIEFIRFGPTDDTRLHCRRCNMSQPIYVMRETPAMKAAYQLGGIEAVRAISDTLPHEWRRGWCRG